MSNELLPCPFCGGEAKHDAAGVPTDKPEFGTAWVVCSDCGSSGTMFDFFADESDIVNQWNTRHVPKIEVTEAMVEAAENLPAYQYDRPAFVFQAMLKAAKGEI
jgi:Lar family restriction alleviation protein